MIILKSQLSKKGGAEKYTLALARAFRDKGHQVTLVTSGNFEGEGVVTLEKESKLSVLRLREFDQFCADFIKKENPRIVFGMDRTRFQTHLRASNGVHAAYLDRRKQEEGMLKSFSFALNPLHRLLLKIEKEAFEHPLLEKLYVNSSMVKREILAYYPKVKADKIKVVHNGVEWSSIEPAFPSERQGYQFLFVGHNYKRKGLEPLLRGLSLLRGEEFCLHVVGREKNRSYFEKLSKELGLSQKVRFWGESASPASFYALADCLIIPSFYDPFANVTVEALAAGLFVVSSQANGGGEVLTQESGSLIEHLNDPESFAASLRVALQHPKTLESATRIRASIAHLDFSKQLRFFTDDIPVT